MLHIPILRKGVLYKSIDVVRVPHYRTREDFVEISQANVGLIRRDLLDQETGVKALSKFSTKELVAICKRAAEHFMNDVLPLGESEQTPDDYVKQLSATTGMPNVLVRKNMKKIYGVMAEMENVLSGLTRNLDFEIFDRGFGDVNGHAMSFYPRTKSLGIVLPSNSPGVHSLWIPSIAMKIPLVLKPGGAEPWSPYRIIQAFIKAGCPSETFSYYPASHAGGAEILNQTGRGMVFGDVSSTSVWKDDPRIEVHGPGYSKVVIAPDCADDWEKYLDVIVESIAANGGRSCINASGVWVTKHADEIADALAQRLAQITPRDEEDETAQIAPFADPNVAKRINDMVESALSEKGAEDVTAKYRENRLVEWNGCSYLLPTIIKCDSVEHTLANKEFLFPFASVVEVEADDLPKILGHSLVVTLISNDESFIARFVSASNVDRLNVGAIPTMVIGWDQPHEGNLFEHLYARRAFQRIGQ
jgi:acyl-CoA reductase-like NAD-dependent aldehyde dehydrogenase